jgi:hypothetical protein
VKYIINPPGWSHDGSTQIAKIMQRELREKEKAESSNS